MKKIKYITTAILVMIGLFFVGEYNVQRTLHSIESAFPHASFDFGIDWRNAASDITLVAERNDVIAFAQDNKYTSLYLLNFDVAVYSTHDLPQTVTDILGWGSRVQSLFRGEIYVSFHSIDSIVPMPTSHFIYLYGSEDNIIAFIDDLSELYERTSGLQRNSQTIIHSTIVVIYWTIAIAFIVFLAFVDMYFQKKEVIIRAMLGSSVSRFVLENLLKDLIFIILLFAIGTLIVSNLTAVMLRPSFLILLITIVSCLNSLPFLALYSVNFKLATSNVRVPKNLLRLSYIIKSAAIVFALVALSSCVMLIQPLRDHITAREFFRTHSDYYFANFKYKTPHNIDDLEILQEVWRRSEEMNQTIYKEYFHIVQPMILSKISIFEEITDFGIIFANIHALDYLQSVIGEISIDDIAQDSLFFIPHWVCDAQKYEAIDFARFTLMGYGAANSYSVTLYDAGIDVLGIDAHSTENEFSLMRDPIIVLDVTPPAVSVGPIGPFAGTVMYRFTDEVLLEISERFTLEDEIMEVTSIYELFGHFWNMLMVGIYTAAIVGLLALILAIITIYRIISIEYTVNAIELCVKKTLGYGVLRKNADTIISLFYVFVLCVITAVAAVVMAGIGQIGYVLAPAGIILLAIVSAILWSTHRVEKSRITDVLKGHII